MPTPAILYVMLQMITKGAMVALLNTPADLAIVAGGYNSSNTTHLVELAEEKLPTYFISSADKIISDKDILHYNYHTKQELLTNNYLPNWFTN